MRAESSLTIQHLPFIIHNCSGSSLAICSSFVRVSIARTIPLPMVCHFHNCTLCSFLCACRIFRTHAYCCASCGSLLEAHRFSFPHFTSWSSHSPPCLCTTLCLIWRRADGARRLAMRSPMMRAPRSARSSHRAARARLAIRAHHSQIASSQAYPGHLGHHLDIARLRVPTAWLTLSRLSLAASLSKMLQPVAMHRLRLSGSPLPQKVMPTLHLTTLHLQNGMRRTKTPYL